LLDRYLYDLTGSSLQSTEQVHRTVAALGIENKKLSANVTGLKEMFAARNQIAHELDLLHLRNKGDRTRRSRTVATTEGMCHQALEVARQIVNAVSSLVSPPTRSPTVAKKAPAKKATTVTPVTSSGSTGT
jgi:nicotinate-nucleotide pyrophosphorylase